MARRDEQRVGWKVMETGNRFRDRYDMYKQYSSCHFRPSKPSHPLAYIHSNPALDSARLSIILSHATQLLYLKPHKRTPRHLLRT